MTGETQAPRFLVVEDDETVLDAVKHTLMGMGYHTTGTRAGHEAIELASMQRFDVCILDVHLQDSLSGLDLVTELQRADPGVVCIVMTGDVSAEMANEAYGRGALAYLEKPISDWEHFEDLIDKAVRRRRREPVVEAVEVGVPSTQELRAHFRQRIAGTSKAMDSVRRQLAAMAGDSRTVLMQGPSGSGKTFISEVLHEAEGRQGPLEMVDVDTREVMSTLFGAGGRGGMLERTIHGTVVLEGMELVAEPVARRIAAAVRAGEVGAQTRVVFHATTREPVDARWFDDVVDVTVRVPGLDERLEDIPQLVYAFLKDVNDRESLEIKRVPIEILENLRRRDWSSESLRGLRAVVEQVALFSHGEVLNLEALPPSENAAPAPGGLGIPSTLPEAYRGMVYTDFKERVLHDFVHLYVHDLLIQTEGNITRASELADMHRPNFRRLMVRFGIDAPR